MLFFMTTSSYIDFSKFLFSVCLLGSLTFIHMLSSWSGDPWRPARVYEQDRHTQKLTGSSV